MKDAHLEVVVANPRNAAQDHIGVEMYPGNQGIEICNSRWMFQMLEYSDGALIASLFVNGVAQDLNSSDMRVKDAKKTLESVCKYGVMRYTGKQSQQAIEAKEVPEYWANKILGIVSGQKPEHE